jgi:hypothetical protein
MSTLVLTVCIIAFVALMWYAADKWDEWAEGEANKNTRIEQERHDLQTAILKTHYGKKGKK